MCEFSFAQKLYKNSYFFLILEFIDYFYDATEEISMKEPLPSWDKRAALVKRSPYLYRVAVITVFRETYNKYRGVKDHPLGTLKLIIRDMTSYYDGHPEDLKGNFSKKLGNIISGKTDGTRDEDVDHFELIEHFLWMHETEEVAVLDLINEVNYLAKFFKSFTKPRMVKNSKINESLDLGKVSDKYSEDSTKTYPLGTIEDGYIFKFIHTKKSEEIFHKQLNDQIITQKLIGNFYLAIKKSRFDESYLAILFSDSMQSEFCIGCYLKGNNLLVMKHHQTLKPVFLEYLSEQRFNPRNKSTAVSLFDIRSNVDISPFGILNPIYFSEKDKDKCMNFSGLTLVSNIKERNLAIKKANFIYSSLREN